MRALAICTILVLAGCSGPGNGPDVPPASDIDPVSAAPSIPGAPPGPPQAARSGFELNVTGLGYDLFEPTIDAHTGTIYVAGDLGYNTPRVIRSDDRGASWQGDGFSIGPTHHPVMSNDPIVHVDRWTERVFVSDLLGTVCATLQWSDGGDWTFNPIGCGHPFGLQDHQSIFTAPPVNGPTIGYDSLVYYCINTVTDGGCAVSRDGGLTFGPVRRLAFSAVEPDLIEPTGLGGITRGYCGGLHGHGIGLDSGRILIPAARCGTPGVYISDDEALTWKRVIIDEERQTAYSDHLTPLFSYYDHDVDLTIDAEGGVWAYWQANDTAWIAHSTDGGDTWQDPVGIFAGTFTHGAVVAGDPDRLAVSMMVDQEGWRPQLVIVENATTTPTSTVLTGPVIAHDCSDSTCGPVGHFLDISVDPDGRPWAAFVDACHCLGDTEGIVATLTRGTSLYGEPLDPITFQ